MTARLPALALAATLLAAPAAADAKIRTFGSSLKAKASVAKAKPSDTAYWHKSASRGAKAPASGQVLSVRIKGKALSDRVPGDGRRGGETTFFLQSLAPRGGGQVQVRLTSAPFELPNRSAGSQTITTYRPENLCIAKGETVGFNTVGGYWPEGYPKGTPLKIFAKRKRSKYRWHNAAGGVGNGAQFSGSTTRGRELLMQVRLGTGGDASAPCRNWRKLARFHRTGLPVPAGR
jgi:hypothetical protein